METRTVLGKTYTVINSTTRADRTAYQLTGPQGGAFSYVEFASGMRRLTAISIYGNKCKVWQDEATPAPDTSKLEKALAKAQANCDRWMEKRAALPVGTSRARITTANAEWMRACELRDRIAKEISG